MSHNQKRSDWKKEFCYAAICGFLYGGTNTLVGHPFDTIKTKMQTQSEHMGLKVGVIDTVRNVYRNEGPVGFYRGWLPPFLGSVVYRSVQFSVFEALYTRWASNTALCQEIPFMMGLEWRTLFAGIAGGSARSFIECPFEYAKVKRQTGQKWAFNQMYLGMREQYPRSTIMMTLYFIFVDLARKHTNLFSTAAGQFIVSGGASYIAWFLIWPLEVLKNLTQAETKGLGNSTSERARFILRTQGIQGFFRGFIPGGQSVFLRNGAAMIVMQKAQKQLTTMGLRD